MIDDKVEVTRVSSRGIWLKANGRKFFLSYYDFPWFKNKPVQAVLHVEESTPGIFVWPQINITIEQKRLYESHVTSRSPSTQTTYAYSN